MPRFFTLVNAILLRPLPVKDPSALHRIGSHDVNGCVMAGVQDVWDDYSYALYRTSNNRLPSLKNWRRFRQGHPTTAYDAAVTTVPRDPCARNTSQATISKCSACDRRRVAFWLFRTIRRARRRWCNELTHLAELLGQRCDGCRIDILPQRIFFHRCGNWRP